MTNYDDSRPIPFSRKVLPKGTLWTYFKFPAETTELQIVEFFRDLGVELDEAHVSIGDTDKRGNLGCMIAFPRDLFTLLLNLLINERTLNCSPVKGLPWFRRDTSAGDWRT